jgi:hypothetical protein
LAKRGLRSTSGFEGASLRAAIDFDKVTRDPNDPRKFADAYGSCNHLHRNDADSKPWPTPVDLGLFSTSSAH